MSGILQINATYGIGSTGFIVRDLDILIKKSGFHSYVAYGNTCENITNGYKIGSYIDSKIHAFLSRIYGKQSYYSIFTTHRLLSYIDQINPDIVHLHNVHNNYCNIIILLNYLKK